MRILKNPVSKVYNIQRQIIECPLIILSKQEIEVHKKEQEGLIRVNQALEAEVKKLLHDPKTNTRLQMFPEFFPSRQK